MLRARLHILHIGIQDFAIYNIHIHSIKITLNMTIRYLDTTLFIVDCM